MQLVAENPTVTQKTGIPGFVHSTSFDYKLNLVGNYIDVCRCVFNYTNSIIGAGIIGLPYGLLVISSLFWMSSYCLALLQALKTAGFYYGIILLVFGVFIFVLRQMNQL